MAEEAHAPNPGSEARPPQPRADAAPASAAEVASSPTIAPAATSQPAPKSSKSAEKAAKAQPTDLKSLNVRQYLEATVVAVLMKGMQEVVKERPEDPLDYLAQYLIRHNPKKHAGTADGAKRD